MNSATKDLENDHIQILRFTDVMEKITEMKAPDTEDLEIVVSLIKEYADGYHHAKEENIFFPALAEKGFSPQQGPVAVMLSEHVQGRNFVQGMAENITLYKRGDQTALEKVFENMTGYVTLLRNHIAKENNILFRMADSVLSGKDHKTMLQEFEKVIPATHGEEGINGFLKEIERLEAKYIKLLRQNG